MERDWMQRLFEMTLLILFFTFLAFVVAGCGQSGKVHIHDVQNVPQVPGFVYYCRSDFQAWCETIQQGRP